MSENRKRAEDCRNGEKDGGDPGMIKWIHLCLALAVVITIGVVRFLPQSKAGSPKISLSETFWNFGRTPQHSRVSHTFWIKNMGSDTLRIRKVKPG